MGSLPLWQSHGLPLATRNQGFGLNGLETKKKWRAWMFLVSPHQRNTTSTMRRRHSALFKEEKKMNSGETDIQEKEQKESQKQPNNHWDEKDKAKVSSMAEIDSKEAQKKSMAGIRALKSLTKKHKKEGRRLSFLV
ncbi:hypothetical protein Tco_0356172 [Tanacetum coccineum]